MPKYRVIVEYGVAYEVDAENEDEAYQMVHEDTEGMTKKYIHEETVAIERIPEPIPPPKMRAEGFFIEEEDLEDLIGTWDDAEKALAEIDAVKKEENNA